MHVLSCVLVRKGGTQRCKQLKDSYNVYHILMYAIVNYFCNFFIQLLIK